MRTILMLLVLLIAAAWAAPAGADDGCVDEVVVALAGDGLLITHFGGYYNCCPEFRYDLAVDDAAKCRELHVTEVETVRGCRCRCCMDLDLAVVGLAPGDWTVVFHWLDMLDGGLEEWREARFEVAIPDHGQAVDPMPGPATFGECYGTITTGVPVPSWGAAKARFR